MPYIGTQETRNLCMTVDPGIVGTGIAIWNYQKGKITSKIPIYTQSITLRKRLDWRGKVIEYAHLLENICIMYETVNTIYVEEPVFMNSAKGLVSARSDSLEKLMYCASFYAGYFIAKNKNVNFVRIIDWKGTMPKDVTERRISKILGESASQYIHGHAWDAVGIGLYLQGIF